MLLGSIKSLKPIIIHGSRDYYHINQKGMTYEIVPVLEVKKVEDIENVTDMSPHHVEWVNKRLSDNLRMISGLQKNSASTKDLWS